MLAGSLYAPFTRRIAGPRGSSPTTSSGVRRRYDCRHTPTLSCSARAPRNRASDVHVSRLLHIAPEKRAPFLCASKEPVYSLLARGAGDPASQVREASV